LIGVINKGLIGSIICLFAMYLNYLHVLLALMIIDYIAAMIVIIKDDFINNKNIFQDKRFIFGLLKKLGYGFVLILAGLLDHLTGLIIIGAVPIFLIFTIILMCGHEAISALKKFGKMGIPGTDYLISAWQALMEKAKKLKNK